MSGSGYTWRKKQHPIVWNMKYSRLQIKLQPGLFFSIINIIMFSFFFFLWYKTIDSSSIMSKKLLKMFICTLALQPPF